MVSKGVIWTQFVDKHIELPIKTDVINDLT